MHCVGCQQKWWTNRNYLAVQQLGLGIFTAGARVRSLVGKLRSCKPHGMAKKKKKVDQESLKHHSSIKTLAKIVKIKFFKNVEISQRLAAI